MSSVKQQKKKSAKAAAGLVTPEAVATKVAVGGVEKGQRTKKKTQEDAAAAAAAPSTEALALVKNVKAKKAKKKSARKRYLDGSLSRKQFHAAKAEMEETNTAIPRTPYQKFIKEMLNAVNAENRAAADANGALVTLQEAKINKVSPGAYRVIQAIYEDDVTCLAEASHHFVKIFKKKQVTGKIIKFIIDVQKIMARVRPFTLPPTDAQ